MPELNKKKDWELSPTAFRKLLQWFDEGEEFEGQRFLEMRNRLVAYFDRKGCQTPNELADDTLNRIARRLEEEGDIQTETPARYCYIVARFVFLEFLRTQSREKASLSEIPRQPDVEEQNMKERMLDCLDQCAAKLDANHRELIFSYYVGREKVKIENRRRLAKSLGITINALSIRACRIRDKLEECVTRCIEEE